MTRGRVALVAVLALSSSAAADPAAKHVHIERATKAHEAGNYELALAELQAAYKLDPDHHLLFALGQVYVQLGRCAEATSHYEQFLKHSSDPRSKKIIDQALAACRPKPVASKPKEPAKDVKEPEPKDPAVKEREPAKSTAIAPGANPPIAPANEPPKSSSTLRDPRSRAVARRAPRNPAPTNTRTSVATTRDPDPFSATPTSTPARDDAAPSWYSDTLGGVLVGGGLLCGAAATVLYLRARSGLDDAEAAPTFAEYQAELDGARSQRLGAVVLAAGAGMFVAAGAIRYSSVRKRSSHSLAVGPARGGGFVTWTGRF